MKKYKLPYFEEIDNNQLEDYYETEIDHDGNKISIDINFKGKQVGDQLFDRMKKFLENIESLDVKNRICIDVDYQAEDGDVVREFIKFHIEELKETLSASINFQDETLSPEMQLIKQLKLVRIGFYPDGKFDADAFAVFDYSVGRELSDELIVINTDVNGKLMFLAWES